METRVWSQEWQTIKKKNKKKHCVVIHMMIDLWILTWLWVLFHTSVVLLLFRWINNTSSVSWKLHLYGLQWILQQHKVLGKNALLDTFIFSLHNKDFSSIILYMSRLTKKSQFLDVFYVSYIFKFFILFWLFFICWCDVVAWPQTGLRIPAVRMDYACTVVVFHPDK